MPTTITIDIYINFTGQEVAELNEKDISVAEVANDGLVRKNETTGISELYVNSGIPISLLLMSFCGILC